MGDHCEQTMQRLNTYIDRELSETEVRKVKAHLDDCPPCEQVFDFQAEMKRLVRKECCTDDAPARLRDWVRQLGTGKSEPAGGPPTWPGRFSPPCVGSPPPPPSAGPLASAPSSRPSCSVPAAAGRPPRARCCWRSTPPGSACLS